MPEYSVLQADRRSQLPEPSPESQRYSNLLLELLCERIVEAGGQLPFDRFMELALYAPGLGYYSAGTRKFGEQGDFITAPEISSLFARCLARQCHQVLLELGGGDLLEFGAGSGVLAADLLLELQALGSLPEHYYIIDLSADLRARQRALLQQRLPALLDRIIWLDDFPEQHFRGVVIANELLDAMPVHRFKLVQGCVLEQYVAIKEGRLSSGWGPASSSLRRGVEKLLETCYQLADGYESELNLRAASWLRALSERIAAGLLLLIDYGYNRSEYYHPQRDRGTLMCHYRHRAHPDALRYPGLQDITAHVDFTSLAEAGLDAGLEVCGYTTQAYFLMGCGLQQLLAESDPEDVRQHLQLMQEAKRLTLPTEMGERFKVLAMSRGLAAQPIGFSLRDLRGRL
ncbi:MAG: SAM-dependent methyltransferase [Chromatiaceae bacterium]|nr:SAM-dependent methyltransferase [Chromatiaceae bacterium]